VARGRAEGHPEFIRLVRSTGDAASGRRRQTDTFTGSGTTKKEKPWGYDLVKGPKDRVGWGRGGRGGWVEGIPCTTLKTVSTVFSNQPQEHPRDDCEWPGYQGVPMKRRWV